MCLSSKEKHKLRSVKYFGGYSEDISEDFVSSFEEHSELCNEKDETKGRK